MISSTVRDLPEHRERVMDACLRQGVMPSMMEHWPALDTDGIAASLQKVEAADLYIGIFAHRYGYIPPGQTSSVTEMEYERAVARGIPRLIFLMDEEHPLKISQIEIEAEGKLRRLKERLKTERTVAFFRSPDDLNAKVIQSLSGFALAGPSGTSDAPRLAPVRLPSFDPRNYLFFVPYRPKGDQVVGRDSALVAVRAQLVGGHRTAIGQTASFQGLGGLGKTQLAVEYAYSYRDQYPNGVIWLNADQDIESQLINLADRAAWAAPESEHKDKLAIAQQRIKSFSHCLIIFDNLENSEAILNYLPHPEVTPHVLVTSRLDHPDFIPVPLDLLNTELSVRLLSQEAGQTPGTEQELSATTEISEKLGGLPLALELAGAYLRHRPIGWARYRDLLNENLKGALPGKFLRGSFTRHEADLYSTLRVDEGVLSGEPLLGEILDVLTWSGPSPMGQSLLCALLDLKNASQLAGAVSLGVALRLLQQTPGAESYSLHRLVCEVRREYGPLAARGQWTLKISERLAHWFQALKRDFADLPRFEAEIAHLHAWQVNVQGFSPKLASRLVWLQAYPPFHRGRYRDAHTWLERAQELLLPITESDRELEANLLTDLCTINNQLGRYTDARKSGEEALQIRLKLFGDKNPETALSFHNLAVVLRVLGETEKSLQYHLQALGIWRGLYGEDHIDTALALDGAGACYAALGRNAESLVFAERALAIREKVLGSRHPDTAISLTNLGGACATQGHHSRALQCEEKALGIANDLFGARSPLKATALKNIAFVYQKLRNLRKALEFGLEALTMRKELFGDQHPETLVLASEVSIMYCDLGRVPDGFALMDEYQRKISVTHSHHEWLRARRRDLHSRYFRPGFRQLPKRKR